MNLIINTEEAISSINKIIKDSDDFMEAYSIHRDIPKLQYKFDKWKRNTVKILESMFEDNTLASKFSAETIIIEKSFASLATRDEVIARLNRGIMFLRELEEDILNGGYEKKTLIESNSYSDIDRSSALIIIRRLLTNFYKHIEIMYQNKVHGNGTILKEDLDKIQIGNEYDVQRILYSLIRPIFPLARVEVTEDTGYKSVRYDIILDEYDVVIEVKCTRTTMTERNLTEEIASDIYHYKSSYLFLFIYDKVKIIKNVDSFVKTYSEDKNTYTKAVESIVIQPITL